MAQKLIFHDTMITQFHSANITVDEYSLQQTHPGASISGNIYWQIGEDFFPEEHWYDYVSTLLCWWSGAIRDLLYGLNFKKELIFMDGPQHMFIDLYDSSSFRITCHPRETSFVTFSGITDKKKLVRSFVLTMTRLVDWCKRQNLFCTDMITLEHNAAVFKKWLKTNCM